MKRLATLVICAVLTGAFILLAGCDKLKARDQLNKGVRSYKSAQFSAAAQHFKEAVRLDPTLLTARLFLATTYQTQFVPNNPSPDNLRLGQQAIRAYSSILKRQPDNANAVAGIASIYFGMGKMKQAEKYYNRQIQIAPNNPDPYYTIGVIDWNASYKPRIAAREGFGITNPTKPFITPGTPRKVIQACKKLAAQNLPKVQQGLQMMHKALEINPQYVNAMTYMNLLYREDADLTCGNAKQSKVYLAKANHWFNRSLAVSKAVAAAKAKAAASAQ